MASGQLEGGSAIDARGTGFAFLHLTLPPSWHAGCGVARSYAVPRVRRDRRNRIEIARFDQHASLAAEKDLG
jgi:hypothetical protein